MAATVTSTGMASISTVSALINGGDWDGLTAALSRMTNSEFRRTEALIRTQVLPSLGNGQFWEAYLHLVTFRRQAFLSGILAIRHLARHDELSADNVHARKVAGWLSTEAPGATIKVLRMAIPLLLNYRQTEEMLSVFHDDNTLAVAQVLMAEDSHHALYALFSLLKHHADDHELVRQTCLGLIRRNTDLAFNMASIVCSYFGISDIRSTFSLQVDPYELNYIDKSYDNFIHVLQGKRPRL